MPDKTPATTPSVAPQVTATEVTPQTAITPQTVTEAPLLILKEGDAFFHNREPVLMANTVNVDISVMHEESLKASGVPFCPVCDKRILVGLGNVKICQDPSNSNCPIVVENTQNGALAAVEVAAAKVAYRHQDIEKTGLQVEETKRLLAALEARIETNNTNLAAEKKELASAQKSLAKLND